MNESDPKAAIKSTLVWKPISEDPISPCTVLLFCGNDYDSLGYAPYREERYRLGYWNGSVWRYCGTGHEIWEWDYDEEDTDFPTHYAEISPPT